MNHVKSNSSCQLGVFVATVPQVATGKYRHCAILPVLYLFLIVLLTPPLWDSASLHGTEEGTWTPPWTLRTGKTTLFHGWNKTTSLRRLRTPRRSTRNKSERRLVLAAAAAACCVFYRVAREPISPAGVPARTPTPPRRRGLSPSALSLRSPSPSPREVFKGATSVPRHRQAKPDQTRRWIYPLYFFFSCWLLLFLRNLSKESEL